MTTLVFPSEGALLVALTAGLVPAEAQTRPARVSAGPEGAVLVRPAGPLTPEALRGLAAAGVAVAAVADGADARDVSCWAEALAVRPGGGEVRGATLFLVEGEAALLALAGDLLGLGCDRQELCVEGGRGRALLRAVAPSAYFVLRAAEGDGPARAFRPAAAGRERVFVEAGHTHPLAAALRPDAGLLLLPARGPWLAVPDGPWTDLHTILDVEVRGGPRPHPGAAPPRRLTVPLALAPRRGGRAASLWVIRREGLRVVEHLLRRLPGEVAGRLLFAVSDGPDPLVVLRARQGREAPADLGDIGEAFAPVAPAAPLYLPAGTAVEPPLSPERLRRALAPGDDRICWLAAADGRLVLESIPERAFLPLADWVDYLTHAHASLLEPWVRSAVFDFAAFTAVADAAFVDPEPAVRRRRRTSRGWTVPVVAAEDAAALDEPAAPEAAPAPAPAAVAAAPAPEAVAALERALLAAAEEERRPLWLALAERQGEGGDTREADLAWARALWDAPAAEERELAGRWAAVALRRADAGDAEALLARVAAGPPRPEAARALIAVLHAAAVRGERLPVGAAALWLDAADADVEVRALWLGRRAVALLAGGDRLALARARDLVLHRLAGGLALERDVPGFVRFAAARAGARDTADAAARAADLEALLVRAVSGERRRSALEARAELTAAYAGLLVAVGLARLGRGGRARGLVAAAAAALDLRDPLHAYLQRAFAARVEQALAGRPAETPLPAALAEELEALPAFLRYKADRLREVSTLLEPRARIQAFAAWGRTDEPASELAGLRLVADPAELERRLLPLVADPATRLRLADGLLELLAGVPEATAVPHLELIVASLGELPAARQVVLLARALLLAGLLDRAALARDLAARLRERVCELPADEVAGALGGLTAGLRGLRRAGLHEEAAALLASLAARAPSRLVRLELAGAQAELGLVDEARRALVAAEAELGAIAPAERPACVHAAARALARLPRAEARAGLERLADWIPETSDAFNTNTHFCRSLLQLVDGLVLSHASDDLAGGDLVRRWLDDDEHHVRRRLQRDLGDQP